MAEIDRSELSIMCLSSFPDLDLLSAITSTKAGETERITASQREHRKEINKIIIKETKIIIMWSR
jgi:hypothetical protein